MGEQFLGGFVETRQRFGVLTQNDERFPTVSFVNEHILFFFICSVKELYVKHINVILSL